MADISRRLVRIRGRVIYLGIELPDGPWHDEPDHVDFESSGFPCILHRGPQGAWCGYVAVPPGHPWHGKDYDDCRVGEDDWPSVHGGLTYANACHGAVCHVAKPGEPEDVWWLGFDCNHSEDVSLSDFYFDIKFRNDPNWPRRATSSSYGESYKTVEYVRAETERLARQAREVSP